MGFEYLIIDDCWMGRARNATGWIDASLNRFPGGIGDLVDYIHIKGLKAGLTLSAGTKTCAGKPGSLGYEHQDAVLLAEWLVDYLKYDDCYNTGVPAETRHKAMSYAINGTGREEFNCLITVSNWGNEGVWDWASDFAHSWRTGPDIAIGDRSKSNIWFQMVRNFRLNL
jgi:alpha-galactosidase